jgi:hypothetical protein
MNLQMMQTRAIRGLPSTVLIALWSCTQPLSIKDLVFWTASNDDDEVRKACSVLERLGYIEADIRERGEKFFRISSSAQMLLPGFAQVLPAPVEQISGSGKSEPEIITVVDEGQKPAESPDFEPKSTPGSGKSDSETGSIMIDDDESINQNKEIHHQSEPGKFPKLEIVLKNLTILFGDELTIDEIPKGTSAELALAWAGKLYQDFKRPGSTLRNPLGTLRSRLNARTPRKLHLNKLSDEYLAAVGLKVERQDELGTSTHRGQAVLDAVNQYLKPRR